MHILRTQNLPKCKSTGLLALLALPLLLASCVRDEEANAECDIETALLQVAQPDKFFYQLSDSFQTIRSDKDSIIFKVNEGADLTALAPVFTITPGATISPASGSVHNFSQDGVRYTVRSESGEYERSYLVMCRVTKDSTFVDDDVDVFFHFEQSALEADKQKYYVWTENNGITPADCWSTGNPGFKLSKSSAKPYEYPTVPLEEGVSGHGVKLETLSTLPFGSMVKMRMAAGNLFLGEFDATQALRDAMQATSFGLPFVLRPLTFSGYYQYTPGATYQDREGTTVPDKTDLPDIYAVLYRNQDADGNYIVLHGDDVMTHGNIVALARVPYDGPTSGWTRFEVEFNYRAALDEDLLSRRGYNLAIVASSSRDGALFCGALGSTLLIDEFCITCKKPSR